MNTESNHRLLISGTALLLALAIPITALAAPPWDGEHRPVLDERYHHDHYYPRLGVVVRDLPSGYRPFLFHGEHWYFHDGVWYVPVAGGFRVASPPVGLRIAVLPPFYTTVWLGGLPYYYANGTYYRWVSTDASYEVVAPPGDADAPGAPPARAADRYRRAMTACLEGRGYSVG